MPDPISRRSRSKRRARKGTAAALATMPPSRALARSESSTFHSIRLATESIWRSPANCPTRTWPTWIAVVTVNGSPSRPRAAAFCTAMAAWAARRGASSTGSRPKTAPTVVGLSSSMRPPKDVSLSSTTSSAEPLSLHSRTARGRPPPARGRRPVRAQAELLHARPHRIAGDPEHGRGARDVPAGLLEDGPHVLAQGVVERARRRDDGRGGGGLVTHRGGELEHVRGDHRPVGQQRDPLEHVAELAHVAGPRVRQEPLLGLRRQGLERQAVVGADADQQMLGEQDHVAPALAQRRKAKGEDGESVVEILAEAALADGGLQIGVGGADDPRVGRLGMRAAQAPDRALLDDGQQLGLERLRQEPDLVQEDRALVRGLEEPGLCASCVGEGAPLVAEQLRLEQRLRNRRAVERHEGAGRARAGAVEHAGHQPLAAPGLAFQQDRRRPSCAERAREQAAYRVSGHLDRRALSEQLDERIHRANMP